MKQNEKTEQIKNSGQVKSTKTKQVKKSTKNKQKTQQK